MNRDASNAKPNHFKTHALIAWLKANSIAAIFLSKYENEYSFQIQMWKSMVTN